MRSTKVKRKLRSCPVCKPHKTGGGSNGTNRAVADELDALAEIELYVGTRWVTIDELKQEFPPSKGEI